MISSDHSDANLTIQDVTTLDDDGVARNTEAITVGMKYTANADSRWAESDLHVYFDQDYLLAGQDVQPPLKPITGCSIRTVSNSLRSHC